MFIVNFWALNENLNSRVVPRVTTGCWPTIVRRSQYQVCLLSCYISHNKFRDIILITLVTAISDNVLSWRSPSVSHCEIILRWPIPVYSVTLYTTFLNLAWNLQIQWNVPMLSIHFSYVCAKQVITRPRTFFVVSQLDLIKHHIHVERAEISRNIQVDWRNTDSSDFR